MFRKFVHKEQISEIGKQGKLNNHPPAPLPPQKKICEAISSFAQDSSLVRRNVVSIGSTDYIPTHSPLHTSKIESFHRSFHAWFLTFKRSTEFSERTQQILNVLHSKSFAAFISQQRPYGTT